jgi:hypothetical protein
MMGELAFRNEEKVGLLAALVLHGALVAVLLMQTVRSEVSVFPERMTVSLATEVGLEAQSPDPVAESRAAIAPTLSEDPAPAPEPAKAEPAARVAPTPPKPPVRTATSQPAPTRDRSRPDRTPAPRPSAAPAKAAEKGGGSRIGDDFLKGAGSSTTTTETRIPASMSARYRTRKRTVISFWTCCCAQNSRPVNGSTAAHTLASVSHEIIGSPNVSAVGDPDTGFSITTFLFNRPELSTIAPFLTDTVTGAVLP